MEKQIPVAVIAAIAFVCGQPERASAQVAPNPNTLVQISGPALGLPGETLQICYQRVQPTYVPQNPVDVGHSQAKERPDAVTLLILDAVTGAQKARKDFTLPVPGSPALPSDPCVTYPIPAVTATATIGTTVITPPGAPPIYLGVVSVSSTLLPTSADISSLEIYTPGSNGTPTNIRHITPAATCQSGLLPCAY